MSRTLLLMLALAACGKKSETPDPKPVDPGSAGSGSASALPPPKLDGDPCENGVARLYAAIQATGTAEEKAANTKDTLKMEIASCKAEPYPPALVACMNRIEGVVDYMDKCYKAAFAGAIDLKIVREFDAAQNNSMVTPSPFSIEGDFVVFNKAGRCGLISKKLHPAEGVLAICGGTVIAGPFTTPDEVEHVATDMRAEMADAEKLKARVAKSFSSTCAACRYTVHDMAGKLIAP